MRRRLRLSKTTCVTSCRFIFLRIFFLRCKDHVALTLPPTLPSHEGSILSEFMGCGVFVAIRRLLLLYFRAIPTKPPRPRHIPSVRPDAKIGLLAAARVDGHGPRLDLNSSVNVEAGGSVQAHKPAVRPLGTTGLAAISKGGTRRSSQAAVVAGSFPAFDPFKSDSGQLPAAFGAPQGGAQSAGSSGGGGGGGGPGQQPSRSSISRV